MTIPQRILDKVQPQPTGCWLWTGSISNDGYGQAHLDGRVQSAHRVLYTLTVGPVAEGLHVDHLCRVRSCVNPAHLEPVTQAENNRRAGAAKTHCPQGHEYTPDNTAKYPHPTAPGGVRSCKACRKIRRTQDVAAETARSELGCKNGHPRTPEHATRRRNGAWTCVTCYRASRSAA